MIDTIKKIQKRKKGAMSWEYIATAILVLVVIVVVLLIFSQGAKKGSKELISKLEGTADQDADGIPNLLDKCPCDSEVGTTWTNTKKKMEDCQKCPTTTPNE
jgi:predicted PurR-regulated permease PerM